MIVHMEESQTFKIIVALIVLWSLPWKGYALWQASQLNHKKWFVALFLLNTASLLEIFYIFKVLKKKKKTNY